MDVLDGRSVISLSDGELMPAFDSLDAEINRLEELRLQLIARIEDTGHAQELGARDAIDLVSKRYRRDRAEVWRDVRLARALPKYAAVGTALTEGIELPTAPNTNDPDTNDTGTNRPGAAGTNADAESTDTESSDSDDHNEAAAGAAEDVTDAAAGVRRVRPMRTAQAAVIVSELERVRSRVPVEDLDVVEEQFVALAAHLTPGELRSAIREVCDLLDSDGPEPEEQKAAARESLTLMSADRGVKFKGYLANENAELLRAVVHAGARPHKTVDGEPDPRSRDKRQADALSTALTIAATAWDTNPKPPTPPPNPQPTNTAPVNAEPAAAPADTAPADTAPADTALAGTSAANARSGHVDAADAADAVPPAAAPGDTSPTDAAASVVGGAGAVGAGTGEAGGRAGGRGQPVPGYGAKANITVTIDLADLKAATADAIGQTVYGDGLSAATIRRLACDANIIPLVLGSNSEPLDVGRQERLVTRAMRRALNTRDRGCVVCGAPPVVCDAHHLISWVDGGETKLNNLALLCRRHHVDLHNGRWTITITHGVVHVARPTWADPQPVRRPNPPIPNPLQPPTTAEPPTPAVAAASAGAEGIRGAASATNVTGGMGLVAVAGGRSSRWRADAATYAEAARFAVWDGNAAAEPDIGPPSFATI
jgi:hypothetical protein